MPGSITELTDRAAVLSAIREFDRRGPATFLERYGFGERAQYYVRHAGRLYQSKAIAAVAFGYQFPERGPLDHADLSGGIDDSQAAGVLRSMGFEIVDDDHGAETIDADQADVDAERTRRRKIYAELAAASDPDRLPPSVLRELRVYGGAQGIWVDKERTAGIGGEASGVTVGVLHTGRSYADDLSEDGVIYHYPSTGRGAGLDNAEVEATKAAGRLGIPLFVIKPGATASTRSVALGWVDGRDDDDRLFLISFDDGTGPAPVADPTTLNDQPFLLHEPRPARRVVSERTQRPAQARFKFEVIRYYRGGCVVCGIRAADVLDAAHLCPKSQRGSHDPRKGLLL